MALHYIASTATAVCHGWRHLHNNGRAAVITENLTAVRGIADGLSAFPPPHPYLEKEVALPPYHSVLQCLQLPLDCLTFFINSQVIQLPWQQFPADTRIRYHLESLRVLFGVFISERPRRHMQEGNRGFNLQILSSYFHFLSALSNIPGMTLSSYHLRAVAAALQSSWTLLPEIYIYIFLGGGFVCFFSNINQTSINE